MKLFLLTTKGKRFNRALTIKWGYSARKQGFFLFSSMSDE